MVFLHSLIFLHCEHLIATVKTVFVVVSCLCITRKMDAELLISSVQARPVLWDKTIGDYKDRIKTTNAWFEVTDIMIPGFEGMPENERKHQGKYMRKFNYISYVSMYEMSHIIK